MVHLDESCLGNGRAGDNPGGAGGLVEVGAARGIERRDFHLHSASTTNNRMALAGAIAALQLLAMKEGRLRLLIVSDSEYLVKGIREWAPMWKARGWVRKGGTIENLDCGARSGTSSTSMRCSSPGFGDTPVIRRTSMPTTWPAGRHHPGDVRRTDRVGYAAWLTAQRARGKYLAYDADVAFRALEGRLLGGDRFARAEGT